MMPNNYIFGTLLYLIFLKFTPKAVILTSPNQSYAGTLACYIQVRNYNINHVLDGCAYTFACKVFLTFSMPLHKNNMSSGE